MKKPGRHPLKQVIKVNIKSKLRLFQLAYILQRFLSWKAKKKKKKGWFQIKGSKRTWQLNAECDAGFLRTFYKDHLFREAFPNHLIPKITPQANHHSHTFCFFFIVLTMGLLSVSSRASGVPCWNHGTRVCSFIVCALVSSSAKWGNQSQYFKRLLRRLNEMVDVKPLK